MPAKKYYKRNIEKGLCSICGKPTLYKTKCGDCQERHNAYKRVRRQQIKIRAVEYKGGKCEKCGQIFHPDVYDFHHRDPKAKENTITQVMDRGWAYLKREIDVCALLCANCHRIEHIKTRESHP
jgi:hypothetical protein